MNYVRFGGVDLSSVINYKDCMIALLVLFAIVLIIPVMIKYMRLGLFISIILAVGLTLYSVKAIYDVVSYPQNIKSSSSDQILNITIPKGELVTSETNIFKLRNKKIKTVNLKNVKVIKSSTNQAYIKVSVVRFHAKYKLFVRKDFTDNANQTTGYILKEIHY